MQFAGPNQTDIIEYNLFKNAGMGWANGGHGDWVQFFDTYTVNNAQINYNTVIQDNSNYKTQGWSTTQLGETFNALSISNNTMVLSAADTTTYVNLFQQHWINGTATVQNNYIDPKGIIWGWQTVATDTGPYTGAIVTSNNINMVTGAYIYPPTGGTGDHHATAITAFSTDSNIAGDNITNDNTLTLTGTAPANSTVKVFDGSTQIGSTTANASGAWSYNTATLADGSHSFTISATASGTTTTSAALTVTVDTHAPGTPTITSFSPDTGTVGDGVTTANTVTLTGTAEANSTVKVYDGATLLGSATANSSGAWNYTPAALSNATHAFTAQAVDAAGNTSGTSAALNVTINAPPNSGDQR